MVWVYTNGCGLRTLISKCPYMYVYRVIIGIFLTKLTVLKLAYFGEMMYYICVAITKLAILLLYVRLTTSRRLQIAIYATGLVAVSSALAFTIVTIFQCEPISEAWDVTGTVEGTCLSVRAMFYAQAASDISQDLIVFVLPIKMLYKMQLPRRQNYALVPVFAIGAFVVISGCLRLFYIQRAEYSTDPSCKHCTDSNVLLG